jgi:hypothetical protein
MAPLLEQLLALRPALELALLPARVPAPAPPVLEPAPWQAALSAHVEQSLGGCCFDSTWTETVVWWWLAHSTGAALKTPDANRSA